MMQQHLYLMVTPLDVILVTQVSEACLLAHTSMFFYFNVVIGSCFESTTRVLSFLSRYAHVVKYLSLLVLMQG